MFGRGAFYVALQACLVSLIAARNVPLAFVVGALVSFTWSGNVLAQIGSDLWDRVVYAVGAGTGTVIGLVVGRWIA